MPQGATTPNQPRSPVQVSAKLDKSLVAYVAAAGAALVSAAQPAEARVVYTATDITITDSTLIDLNHDGIPDFAIGFHQPYRSDFLTVTPLVNRNAVRVANRGGAQAGFSGFPVGTNNHFVSNSFTSYSFNGLMMAVTFSYGDFQTIRGPWANTTDRYLGLKFVIRGYVHFGWARLSVGDYKRGGSVVLTGFAYETVRGAKILEGDTGPDAEISGVEPPAMLGYPTLPGATLGLLARGADGLTLWRRDQTPDVYKRDDGIA